MVTVGMGVRYQWEGGDVNHVLCLTSCMMHKVCLCACGPAMSEVGEVRAWQVLCAQKALKDVIHDRVNVN